MVVDCKFKLEEIKRIAKSMIVLVDSREKQNAHILTYFDKIHIKYEMTTLNFGDYSFYLSADPAAGVKQDMYFHKEIIIERKSSLEELSNNLGQERERFEKELLKASKDRCKLFLMVEAPGGYTDIMEHRYGTQFKPSPYIASLKTFESRYGVDVQFIDPKYAGYMIHSTFYYHLRENMN